MKQKRVLVTGGAGFIGSNLTEALLTRGCQVTCLDNFSTGKEENVEPFLRNPLYRLVRGDIRDFSVCQELCREAEIVFHEAALGSVPRSVKDPVLVEEVNIGGFVKMLTAAKDGGVSRFVYASSSSVYGDQPLLPKKEECIGKPLSPYAVTKRVNELYAENFHALYGIDCIGLRYFNVFGRRQDPESTYAAVIPRFMQSLLDHEKPVINGDGSYSRDFTYIDNVIQANLLAAKVADPEALNTVYNVACGEKTDLNTLFFLLKTFLAEYDPAVASAEVLHGPARQGDIPHSLADISKARKLLGYEPEFDFEEGLRLSARWYAEHRK